MRWVRREAALLPWCRVGARYPDDVLHEIRVGTRALPGRSCAALVRLRAPASDLRDCPGWALLPACPRIATEQTNIPLPERKAVRMRRV